MHPQHRGAVQEFSRGLSERSERYPRSVNREFLAPLRGARTYGILFRGLRASRLTPG
jgi:hypothetical protein